MYSKNFEKLTEAIFKKRDKALAQQLINDHNLNIDTIISYGNFRWYEQLCGECAPSKYMLIHKAIWENYGTNTLQLLLDLGADPNAFVARGFQGYDMTAMDLVFQSESVQGNNDVADFVKVLVDAGADPNQAVKGFDNYYHFEDDDSNAYDVTIYNNCKQLSV